MTDLADIVSSAFWRVNPPDADPVETREWLEAFDALVETEGRERATFLLRKLLDHARARRVPLPPVLNTPYKNSIALAEQPQFPGNLELESRLSAIVRWNALAMVVRANRAHPELGGHIASYASAADLFEVGFNHFFRADDLVYFQPHSAPGRVRARLSRRTAFGRAARQLSPRNRRQGPVVVLPSVPDAGVLAVSDRLDGPRAAQRDLSGALHALSGAPKASSNRRNRKVWAFVGDGEMDEPESLAGLSLAAREGLDNLIFVVNCNLQRLDGPVRGNGSIVQELEGLFAGAGWNVIKLLWGSDWDPLFARDHDGVLLKRLHETVDGEFQTYAATDGGFNREHFFNKYPELRELIAGMSDDDIDRLRRGGHDPVKTYAAYHAASRHKGQPTVILAKTKKGYGMGLSGQGKMGTHQQKKLDDEALRAFRDRFALPLSDEDVAQLRFYHPGPGQPGDQIPAWRDGKALGGYVPSRSTKAETLAVPPLERVGAQPVHHHGVRAAAVAAAEGREARPARGADRRRRGAHLRHADAVPPGRHLLRASASSTSPRTTTSCSTTARRRTGRSSRRASPRPARFPPGSPRRPRTRRTARRCCRSTSTTRCSASSASAT